MGGECTICGGVSDGQERSGGPLCENCAEEVRTRHEEEQQMREREEEGGDWDTEEERRGDR